MITMRPGRSARFHVELAADGQTSIRDSASGELHPAPSVADAHVDAEYLNAQHARRNAEEIRLHLLSLAELSRSSRRPIDTPPPELSAELVLSAAGEWSSATTNAAELQASRTRVTALSSVRRELASAESALSLSASRISEAVRRLYADGESAHRVLAETSRSVPLPELADLVELSPTLFGNLGESSLARFGPAAVAAEHRSRTTDLAAAIRGYDDAAAALNAARDTAAASLSLGPDTAADALSRALDDRIRQLSSTHDAHPHHSVSRSADRLRALLAIADQKTMDTVLQCFPAAAPIAREARSLSTSAARERDR